MSLDDARTRVGEVFGPSSWMLVDQATINGFGRVTRDEAWIHVDEDRARREAPGGITIAHGLLTLALVPHLQSEVFPLAIPGLAYNYGLDSIRFLKPVPAGARIRMTVQLTAIEQRPRGDLVRLKDTVYLENETRPAMVADWLMLVMSQP